LRLHLPERVRRVAVTAVLAVGLVLLGGCSSTEQESIKRLAQPVGASDRTEGIHSLWMGSWLAAMLVGVVVWGLIIYACIRFRRRRDDEIPVQTRYNLPIEILYTVAPVIIVLVLFYFTVQTQDKVLASAQTDNGKSQHTVTVVGQQWSWTFNYDKDSALDGRTTVFDSGTPAQQPTLYLPVNESVNFQLRSADVIHSFWVPAFLFKMDVIPGRDNNFTLTPTRTGTFQGRCAELCGTYHSRMLFNVKVVSASDYAAHLTTLQKQGNIGPALGGSEVDQQNGLINKVQNNDDTPGGPQ
jgi:cytochrome c oxidase subunit II